MRQNRSRESGNVFMFILLGIVLFGALAFTIARGFRSDTTSSITTRQAELAATDILDYAQRVGRAVGRLRRNGCSENEISFENGIIAGYTNASSPGDNSCHVFSPNGGKIQWGQPQEKWLDNSQSANFNYLEYFFSSSNRIVNLSPSSNDDLLIILDWVNETVCEEINQQIFNQKTITEDPTSYAFSNKTTGVFDTISAGIDLSSLTLHNGQTTACFSSQNNGGFHFYHVLIAR